MICKYDDINDEHCGKYTALTNEFIIYPSFKHDLASIIHSADIINIYFTIDVKIL